MVTDLVPGANMVLPGDVVALALPGPFDLSAVVLGTGGRVGGDADFVFFNQPSAPGVTLGPGRVTVAPARLRRGADRVVVIASPEQERAVFGSLPAPAATVAGRDGVPFARLVAPRLRAETAVQLAELYRRAGQWRLRAIGQGYADGLAGLARDFGVDVRDDDAGDGHGVGHAAGPSGLAAEVVAATNVERARHRLARFTPDPRLAAAAQAHSDDMVRRGFFSHHNPDGAEVWDRAVAAGYVYRKVAENIAAGQRNAADVVAGWMESPGHRANILDADLAQIGVGHAVGGPYGNTWTQVFGTPR